MKNNLILVILFCFTPLNGMEAQERSVFVSGNVSYIDNDWKDKAMVVLAVGYQFNHHWALGVELGTEIGKYSPYRMVTPFVRYTVWDIKKIKIFVDALGSYKFNNADGGTASYGEVGMTPGISYSIGRKWEIMAHYLFIGYTGDTRGVSVPDVPSNAKFHLDPKINRLSLGVKYCFWYR